MKYLKSQSKRGLVVSKKFSRVCKLWVVVTVPVLVAIGFCVVFLAGAPTAPLEAQPSALMAPASFAKASSRNAGGNAVRWSLSQIERKIVVGDKRPTRLVLTATKALPETNVVVTPGLADWITYLEPSELPAMEVGDEATVDLVLTAPWLRVDGRHHSRTGGSAERKWEDIRQTALFARGRCFHCGADPAAPGTAGHLRVHGLRF